MEFFGKLKLIPAHFFLQIPVKQNAMFISPLCEMYSFKSSAYLVFQILSMICE